MPIKEFYEIQEQARVLMDKLTRPEQKELLKTLVFDYELSGEGEVGSD